MCTFVILLFASKIWFTVNKEESLVDLQKDDSLKAFRVNVVNLNEQLTRGNYSYQSLRCLLTKTEPSFHICTYPATRDKFISAALQTDGIWEPYITPLLQGALTEYPKSLLIDVGANIGYYSLLAARMGHTAIAVEPKEENLLRLQMGVDLNNVGSKINLVQNVLYDFHTNVTLTRSNDNQGGIWIKSISSKPTDSYQNESSIEAITMDHLLTITDIKVAVLKIDIGKPLCINYLN